MNALINAAYIGGPILLLGLFGWFVAKTSDKEEDDFYGQTTGDDEVDYYAHDEKGREFLREFHKDYRRLL